MLAHRQAMGGGVDDLMARLARERRARLAAERMLAWKSRALEAAQERLAEQARALAERVVEERQSAEAARHEAARARGQAARFAGDLTAAQGVALRTERRMREALDAMRDGFALFDAEGALVLANPAWEAVLGTGATGYDAVLARLVPLLVVESPADWLARMRARAALRPVPPEVLSFRSGPHFRLEERLTGEGDRVALLIDITAEMRLRAGVEALPDGFAIFDREDRLRLYNARFGGLYPLVAGAMEEGAAYGAIVARGVAAGQYAEGVDWVAAHGAAALEVALADGRRIRVQHHPTPDGGRVALHSDVTEALAAATQLQDARQAAEAANRAKSAFLANMSHEIRTPMNGVVGMAELLCETELTEEQRLFAETIRSSGAALLVIINDVLDYSKIEAGRLVLHPEPFDLERLIHEVLLLCLPTARAAGVELRVDYDVLLPTRLVGDAGRMRQVLTNLIGNAVKFTAQGHVMVRVVGAEAGPGAVQLHLTVEDTGIGIAADQLEHIFGEFAQVEAAANRRYEGTGLGLAITRRLVEAMGGAVWVESEPGAGSCFGFRLVLPVAEAEGEPALPAGLRRVLVVEGDHADRMILERQLRPCGMAVVAVRTAAEALAALRGGAVDAAILSHDPPGLDAMALAVALRDAGWAGPVLLLAAGAAGLEAAARDVGAELGEKPMARAELYRRLSAMERGAVVPAPPDAGARRMRVLVAEDNRTNQLVFGKMVRDCRIELQFAANGREAVALWRDWQPDLVFMDIAMPEMDGCAAAEAIRAAEGGETRVPILALTAHAMEADRARVIAAGMDRHLTKPLSKPVILGALEEFRPRGVAAILPEAAPDSGAEPA